jgi:hypothetical protein
MIKPNATRQEYENINALNYSGMKELLKSPLHYQTYLKREHVETKALRIGTLVHLAVLQPEVWQTFKPAPVCDRRTKEGKDTYNTWLASLKPSEQVVDLEEHEVVVRVAKAAEDLKDSLGVQFVKTEVAMTACEYSVPLKCSIDAIGSDGFIYDLKTTSEEASANGFKRSALAFKYYLQAFIYLRIYQLATGEKAKGFRFLVIEKDLPNAGGIFELGEEFMYKASMEYNTALSLFTEATSTGNWKGYPTEVQTVDLPKFKSGDQSPVINFA